MNMDDNLKKLVDLAKQDKELGAKLQSADKEKIIALGKEQGITLTEADFEMPKGKVNDDELAAVAGGGYCFCAWGGGGKSDDYEKACACVIVGIGTYTNGAPRCDCGLYGSGDPYGV